MPKKVIQTVYILRVPGGLDWQQAGQRTALHRGGVFSTPKRACKSSLGGPTNISMLGPGDRAVRQKGLHSASGAPQRARSGGGGASLPVLPTGAAGVRAVTPAPQLSKHKQQLL